MSRRRERSDPRVSAYKRFAEQNLDAGRIQFARADEKHKGSPRDETSRGEKAHAELYRQQAKSVELENLEKGEKKA